MPKERITGDGPFVVKVGWDHHGSVQVGVEGEGERSLFWLLLGDTQTLTRLGEQVGELTGDNDEAVGRSLLNVIDVASGDNCSGVWSNLDRYGLNHLIRILRRARDQAFGKDE